MPLASWIVTICMAALLIVAQITIKSSVQSLTLLAIRQHPFMSLITVITNPMFWLGFVISGCLFLMTLYNYITTSLNVFMPVFTALYMILMLLLSAFILHESVTALKVTGYLLLIVGIILIGYKGA